MLDLEIRNFQSIEHTSLQVQGFTALTGRSNIGKSAIVRAVKAALTGAPSTSFVRHSAQCLRKTKAAKTCKCYCSVHIKTENVDLLWEKGDTLNRYTFNGQIFDKAERGTPDFLQPAYAPVKVGEDKELLQVADQFNPIFLLNQSGGVVADVLSDVAHLDRVNIAIRLVEKDRREAAATRKVREGDVVQLTQRLVLFDGLDPILADVQAIEQQLLVVETLERALARLGTFLERCSALGQHITALDAAAQIEAPEPSPLLVQSLQYSQMVRFIDILTVRLVAIRSLQAIAPVQAPAPQPLDDLQTLFGTLNAWVDRLRAFKAWRARTQALNVVPALFPERLTTSLRTLIDVARLLDRYRVLTKTVADLSAQSGALVAIGASIQSAWADLGVCPTCVQPFNSGV